MDWIAFYAAIIATLALAWQVFRWWRERDPPLEIDLSLLEVTGPRQADDPTRVHMAELLVIEVRNRSATRQAYVPSVGWGVKHADGRPFFTIARAGFEGATLPGVIEPNNAGLTSFVLRRDRREIPIDGIEDPRLFAWAWPSTASGRLESRRYDLASIPRRPALRRDVPTPPWLWASGDESEPQLTIIHRPSGRALTFEELNAWAEDDPPPWEEGDPPL